jgi:hypothetical protein
MDTKYGVAVVQATKYDQTIANLEANLARAQTLALDRLAKGESK